MNPITSEVVSILTSLPRFCAVYGQSYISDGAVVSVKFRVLYGRVASPLVSGFDFRVFLFDSLLLSMLKSLAYSNI